METSLDFRRHGFFFSLKDIKHTRRHLFHFLKQNNSNPKRRCLSLFLSVGSKPMKRDTMSALITAMLCPSTLAVSGMQ